MDNKWRILNVQYNNEALALTTIWLFDDIGPETAQYVCYEILKSQEEDEICIFINSQGGDLYSAIAIINTMRISTVPIRTIVCGTAFAMALHVAAAGTAGYRQCMKNSSYMYNEVQLSFGESSTHYSMSGYLEQFKKVVDMEKEMLIDVTNFTSEIIDQYIMTGHEIFFTAQEALKYGIVDEVIDYANISK